MALTLNEVATTAGATIDPTEAELDAAYALLGPSSTAADLLKFQALLAINSTLTAVFSAVLKERADTLKGVCQKF